MTEVVILKIKEKLLFLIVLTTLVLTACENTKLKNEFYGRQDNITENWRTLSADIQNLNLETPKAERPVEMLKQLQGLNDHISMLNDYDKFIRANRKDLSSMKIKVDLELSDIDSNLFYAEQKKTRLIGYKNAIEQSNDFSKKYKDMLAEFTSLKAQAENPDLTKSEKLGLLTSLKLKAENYDSFLSSYEIFIFGKRTELMDMGYDMDTLQQQVREKRNEI
jgi:hypothetical protein